MDGLDAIFRWLHVFAGIMWIGHLYFFNFVNGRHKQARWGRENVVPELMPRALYWFRWERPGPGSRGLPSHRLLSRGKL
jgi:uncharacterized membrane protein